MTLEAPDGTGAAPVPPPHEELHDRQVSATHAPAAVPPMAPPPGGAAGPGPGPGEEPAELTMPLLLDRSAFAAEPEEERGGRRRGALVALVAALAVAGTAAFAAGVLGGEERVDRAAPDATASSSTASAVSEAPSPSASESATASESASPSASTSPTESASPTASPSRTASARAAAPRPSASAPAPSRSASASATEEPESAGGPTLRRGDSGPEVSELQRRLKEIWAYRGPDNGYYGDRVEQAVADFQSSMDIHEDPRGVYGPTTREALEAVTEG
ncbi:peptidoglycan-binding domain-containing protein [Streptomyces tritici]|uniref:peptidoglycan-binding domain-containing protein n=1 Tax=Streptomyces tritici TaxID=2054410 RepID=UPI003AF0ADCC